MMTVPFVDLRMKGRKKYFCLRWCDTSIWILIVTLFMLPHYSESACYISNCVSTECNGQTCNRCIDGYYLHLNGSCVQCQQALPNCVTCSSSSVCDVCNDGYYLQSGSCVQCQQVLPNCVTCSSSSVCDVCNDGYYLQSGSCVQCQQVLPNCVTCSSSSVCDVCNDGYYLQSGSCVQCQQVLPNCVTCRNSSFCDVCNDGYYLQSANCYNCYDRCALCTSYTQCTKCEDIYYDLKNYCSHPCSTNCTDSGCDDTTGYCYDCKPGTYGLICRQDCNLCRDGQCDLRQCTNGCKDGYYQDNTVGGYSYCHKCVYVNCITCSNGTYCTQCEQGYYRNYYRVPVNGRGQMNCLKCYESCFDCSFTEHCHEDCIQQCSDPVNSGTTESTGETTTTTSTTLKTFSSSNAPHTSTHEFSESAKFTESTPIDACPCFNEDFCEEVISCRQQVKTCRVGEDQYQLTFGHGIATGICITMVIFGCVVGIALFLRRKTKLRKNCLGRADDHSNEGHEYVNTTMTDIVSVTSSDQNKVHNDTHAVSRASTNSGVINHYQNIESSREYVSLGERSTQESDYTDLQNT